MEKVLFQTTFNRSVSKDRFERSVGEKNCEQRNGINIVGLLSESPLQRAEGTFTADVNGFTMRLK